jgi:hypothetical protein
VKPEELRLEEAVARVSLRASACSPPEVTASRVRQILKENPVARSDPSTGEDYLAWDEPEAIHRVWLEKAGLSSPLSDSSSAGQSSSMSQVHLHCLRMAAITQPYRAS